jgi:hypothetical protein
MPDDAGGHPDKGASMVSGVSAQGQDGKTIQPEGIKLRLYRNRNYLR